MHWGLMSAGVGMALIDTIYTYKRFGFELNPLVRWLGPLLGPSVGVLMIQSVWVIGLAHLLSPIPLALLVGASLYRTYLQVLSSWRRDA